MALEVAYDAKTDKDSHKPLEKQETIEHFERRLDDATPTCKEAWERLSEAHRFLRGGSAQWDEEDYKRRKQGRRPALTINDTLLAVNAVAGRENTARYQPTFLGRGPGDDDWAEILREFYRKSRQRGNFEQVESDQFRENVAGGLGCVEMTQDMTAKPWGVGATKVEGVPIWETVWGEARERNLEDRLWDARGRWIAWEEFYALFPEHAESGELEGIVQSKVGWVPPQEEKTHRWPWLYTGEGKWSRPRRREVFLIDYCWKERQIHYIIDPEGTGQFKKVTREELEGYRDLAGSLPPNLPHPTWVVRRANIAGKQILREETLPYTHLPRFYLTGYPYKQEEEVEHFGLVDVMRDPAMFKNLVVSMSISILQHMPKGPFYWETGAFKNPKEAQAQHAGPAPWVEMNVGGYDKIHQDPPPQYPAFLEHYMRLADDAMFRPTGLNQTALGQIPDPRRVSGTVVQSVQESVSAVMSYLFDSLRLYRRLTGLHFLEMMQHHYDVPDVARVVGDERAQLIPPKEVWGELNEFDVVVEEEPVTRTEKEKNWQFFTNTDIGMNMINGGMMPPEILVEVAPNLSESARRKWLAHLDAMKQQSEEPPPEESGQPPGAPMGVRLP